MTLITPVKQIVEESSNPLLGKHKSWERVELRLIGNVLNGFAFKSRQFAKDKGIPLLRIRDVGKEKTEVCYDGNYDPQYIIKSGDLVVGMDGDFKSAIWKGKPSLLNQRVCKIDVNEQFYFKKFLELVLPVYLDAIHEKTSSQTVKHLSSSTIKEIPLPLPPTPEQTQIVGKCEVLFTRLDAGVASLQKVNNKLQLYRQAVLKHAFNGKLTEEWRKTHKNTIQPAKKMLKQFLEEKQLGWENTQIEKMKAKSRRFKNDKWKLKYRSPPKVDEDKLPTLPDGWIWTNFEQLAEDVPNAIKAGPFGSALKKSFYAKKGFKIYGQEQVILGDPFYGDYYIDEDRYKKLKSCMVKSGDILISLVGTIGNVLVLPEGIEHGIINPRLVKLSLNKRLVNQKFIKFYLESSSAVSYFSLSSHGGTMKILNLSILKKLPIPLPPLKEQEIILESIELQFSIGDEVEKTTKQVESQSEFLRQSILKTAFNGKLVVQNSVDEPAEKLLERIRQQNEKQTKPKKVKRRKTGKRS